MDMGMMKMRWVWTPAGRLQAQHFNGMWEKMDFFGFVGWNWNLNIVRMRILYGILAGRRFWTLVVYFIFIILYFNILSESWGEGVEKLKAISQFKYRISNSNYIPNFHHISLFTYEILSTATSLKFVGRMKIWNVDEKLQGSTWKFVRVMIDELILFELLRSNWTFSIKSFHLDSLR